MPFSLKREAVPLPFAAITRTPSILMPNVDVSGTRPSSRWAAAEMFESDLGMGRAESAARESVRSTFWSSWNQRYASASGELL